MMVEQSLDVMELLCLCWRFVCLLFVLEVSPQGSG